MDFSLLESIGLNEQLFEKDISGQKVELDSETVIFKSGDSCGAFLVLLSGQVRVEITTKSGRDLMLYRMSENDTCIITTSVLLNDEKYYARAIAETPVSAIAISAADFHKALTLSHEFSRYVISGYAQRISSLISLLDRISSKDIDFELSNLLLQEVTTDGTVELTQQEIARDIGTAREVVSRKLSALESKGIVKTMRGKILIIDNDYLQGMISI